MLTISMRIMITFVIIVIMINIKIIPIAIITIIIIITIIKLRSNNIFSINNFNKDVCKNKNNVPIKKKKSILFIFLVPKSSNFYISSHFSLFPFPLFFPPFSCFISDFPLRTFIFNSLLSTFLFSSDTLRFYIYAFSSFLRLCLPLVLSSPFFHSLSNYSFLLFLKILILMLLQFLFIIIFYLNSYFVANSRVFGLF